MSTLGSPEGSPAPAQPWSPYPVQDWEAMPVPGVADPPGIPASGPPESAWVDPRWGPPRPPRPRWLAFVVLGLVTCLVATGFYVADRFGEQGLGTAAQAFVAEDGAVTYTDVETRAGGQPTVRAQFVTESARFTGATALTAVDFTFGSKLLIGLDVEALTGTPFWRTTTTEIGRPASSQQLVRVYRAAGAVELVGESGPGLAHVYRPAVVELPADVAPGRTWSGSGSAGAALDYRSEFRAGAGERGCLRVTGSIAYSAASGGQPGPITAVDKTWCPAAGITAATAVTGSTTVSVTALSAGAAASAAAGPAAGELPTVSDPVTWTAPAAWRREEFGCISFDQNFGQHIMTGAPSSVPPVLTAAGLIIRATSASDLVAFTPKTPTEWVALWRMHPGGTLLSATAFGDVVVATTSRRQVVAYSASGVRLWQHDLDELAFRAPVRLDDDTVALVDGAGSLRALDLRTGSVRWQADVGVEVIAAPIGDPRAVVVFGGDGTATAFRADTGAEMWRRDLAVNRATVVGDTLVTQNASTLTALSLTTGESRWLQVVTGTVNDLQSFDGHVVLATQLGTTILTEDGVVRARRPPYELLSVTSSHLVGWGTEVTDVLDRNLATTLTIDTPDRNLSSSGLHPLTDRYGIYLFAGDWSFQTWSDQP